MMPAGSSLLVALHSAACSSEVLLDALRVDSASEGARLTREVLRGSSRLTPAVGGCSTALISLCSGVISVCIPCTAQRC